MELRKNNLFKRLFVPNRKRKEWIWGYFLVAPTIIGLIILNIIPIFQVLKMSFYKSGDFGRNDIFIGFENYIRLLGDEQVWQATINTLKYTFFVVPLNVIIALILATILNKKIKGRDIYRTIYLVTQREPKDIVSNITKKLEIYILELEKNGLCQKLL